MFVIAIPSYKRADQLNDKTLHTLNRFGIPKELINVFVVEEEYETYHQSLNSDWYNKLIVGEKGVVQQREFIQHYYPEQTHVVGFDDDVCDIDLSLTPYQTLTEFITKAFEECEQRQSHIWGVYPVHNPFFRNSKKDITEDLCYIIASFYGFINRYDDDLTLRLTREGNKEDVERSILYWLKDKKTVRFNRVGFKTKYYGTGGLGGLKERIPLMKKGAEVIHEAYPDITKIKVRKNGLYEIVFAPPKPKRATASTKRKRILPTEPQTVDLLQKLDASSNEVQAIYDLLETATIPLQTGKTGRAPRFGKHRAMTLGMITARITRQYGLSKMSKRFPDIYEAVKKWGESFVPFHFDAIHINKNVVCPRHLDPTNTGKSCLVSIGDYQGCNLVIENVGEFDTRNQPIIFDGTKAFHYNTPLEGGVKYSFVFFPNK